MLCIEEVKKNEVQSDLGGILIWKVRDSLSMKVHLMLISEYSRSSHTHIKKKKKSDQQILKHLPGSKPADREVEVRTSLAGTLEVQGGQCGRGAVVTGEGGRREYWSVSYKYRGEGTRGAVFQDTHLNCILNALASTRWRILTREVIWFDLC